MIEARSVETVTEPFHHLSFQFWPTAPIEGMTHPEAGRIDA